MRPAGEDIAAGQLVFTSGTVLGPGHLGVLASVGRKTVRDDDPRARVDTVETFPTAPDGLDTGFSIR